VFGIDVWSWTEENVETDFFGKFEDPLEVVGAGFEVEMVFCCAVVGWRGLVMSLEYLKGYLPQLP